MVDVLLRVLTWARANWWSGWVALILLVVWTATHRAPGTRTEAVTDRTTVTDRATDYNSRTDGVIRGGTTTVKPDGSVVNEGGEVRFTNSTSGRVVEKIVERLVTRTVTVTTRERWRGILSLGPSLIGPPDERGWDAMAGIRLLDIGPVSLGTALHARTHSLTSLAKPVLGASIVITF